MALPLARRSGQTGAEIVRADDALSSLTRSSDTAGDKAVAYLQHDCMRQIALVAGRRVPLAVVQRAAGSSYRLPCDALRLRNNDRNVPWRAIPPSSIREPREDLEKGDWEEMALVPTPVEDQGLVHNHNAGNVKRLGQYQHMHKRTPI